MSRYYLISVFFILAGTAYAQQPIPGGVKGLYLWNVAKNTHGKEAVLASQLKTSTDTAAVLSGKIYTMNNNPAVCFNGKSAGIQATINLHTLQNYSLFTVCGQTDTLTEQAIFTVENDTSTDMVITNRRMALLQTYKYANYDKKNLLPRIYTYIQNNRTDTSNSNRQLRFGQTPRKQSLPISAFNGIVPEILLYRRVLSYKERLKALTYLALKYGIPLNQDQPVDYISSNGDVVWDAQMNAGYSKNMAGICRDEASGLNQPVSECLHTPGLMKISTNGEFANNSFVVWGDNEGEMRFLERNHLPKCLGREWRINVHNASNTILNFQTNVLAIEEINPLNTGETYWLMIDRTGTGTFPFGKTNYSKCIPGTPALENIEFKTVAADNDSSGADVYTIIAMPALFTRSIAINPDCNVQKSGVVQTQIVGGTPPYKIKITNRNNSFESQEIKTTSDSAVFRNIAQGSWYIQVTDDSNATFNEKIWVSNQNLWENPIAQKYTISEGETVNLDASAGMTTGIYSYLWITPDGEKVCNEKLSISKPGTYYLSITNTDGCNVTNEISVTQTSGSNIKKMELFPNPATNGQFVCRISLNKTDAVSLTISDAQGKILKVTNLQNSYYYWYSDIIKSPGIYLIIVSTGNDKQTMKLLVR
jgi:hypothetical protein